MTALDRTPSRRQLLAIGGAGAAAVSLGAPAPALALPAPDTPIWAAFRRWAAAQHASAGFDLTDSDRDHWTQSAAQIERELITLQPSNDRDIACLGYLALHVADYCPAPDNPVLLADDANAATLAFVSALMRIHPEVAAVILANAQTRNAQS